VGIAWAIAQPHIPTPAGWETVFAFLSLSFLVLTAIGWIIAHSQWVQKVRRDRGARMLTIIVIAIIGAACFVALWLLLGVSRETPKTLSITPENIEPTIRDWINSWNGRSAAPISDPKNYFSYRLVHRDGSVIGVSRTKGNGRFITLSSTIGVYRKERAMYDKLTQPERDRFFRELRSKPVRQR
jgi:hypothetical protein